MDVAWTDYLKYRAALRGYDLKGIESILKSSKERYVDTATNRHVVVGRCSGSLVQIPYEQGEGIMTPVTVHATSRQQIEFRIKTGRLIHE